jgi:hypothetical protein
VFQAASAMRLSSSLKVILNDNQSHSKTEFPPLDRAIASKFKKQAYIGTIGWDETIVGRIGFLKIFGKCGIPATKN